MAFLIAFPHPVFIKNSPSRKVDELDSISASLNWLNGCYDIFVLLMPLYVGDTNERFYFKTFCH